MGQWYNFEKSLIAPIDFEEKSQAHKKRFAQIISLLGSLEKEKRRTGPRRPRKEKAE